MNNIVVFFCLQIIFCCNVVGIDQTSAAESMSGLNQVITEEVLKDVAKETIKAATEEVAEDVVDAAADAVLKELKNALDVGFTVLNLYSLINDAANSAIFLKKWANPSQEEICESLKVAIAYSYLKKKKELKECLVKNVNGEINCHGRPKNCEEIARMFALMGGDDDVEELTAIYKRVHKRYDHLFID